MADPLRYAIQELVLEHHRLPQIDKELPHLAAVDPHSSTAKHATKVDEAMVELLEVVYVDPPLVFADIVFVVRLLVHPHVVPIGIVDVVDLGLQQAQSTFCYGLGEEIKASIGSLNHFDICWQAIEIEHESPGALCIFSVKCAACRKKRTYIAVIIGTF